MLIAFNIYLNSQDVGIARRIAKTIRFSGGGLRYLKAMGVFVDGLAQVSMNLTDFHHTPLAQVVEMVRREALRYGVTLHHSELVGLVPQQALVDATVWYTQMDEFRYDQILENKLSAAIAMPPQEAGSPLSTDFLEQLAGAQPTPGGGSASAFTAAEGAALVAMVARLTIGKKNYAAVEQEMWQLVENAENLRRKLTDMVAEDATVFEKVLAAMKLPHGTAEQEMSRHQAIQLANLEAAKVPLQTARLALEVLALSVRAAQSGNRNAISDAVTASALAQAAIVGAGSNVRINLAGLVEQSTRKEILTELEEIERKAALLDKEMRRIALERANLNIG